MDPREHTDLRPPTPRSSDGAASTLLRPFRIIRDDLRAYLLANGVVYGLLIVGLLVGVWFPDVRDARVDAVLGGGALASVTELRENVWLLAAVTLLNNVLVASIAVIVLPSLAIPFAGIAVFAISLVDSGILLAPVDEQAAWALLPHSVVLLVEFQAYVLLIFGVYLHGRAWLRPASVGAGTRRRGYLRGLTRIAWLGLLALVIHIVAAIYEAFEIAYLL